jgi:hypothetical protein
MPVYEGAVRSARNRRRAMIACRNGAGNLVPLWGIPTYFCYAPRRVECGEHGVSQSNTFRGARASAQ